MNCPVCTETNLQMTERQGVEIDYCPKCRGVWLDRGELDKIIDRASADLEASPRGAPAPQQVPPPPPQQASAPAYPQQNPYPYGRKPDDSDYKFRYPQQGGHYPRKKKNILKDIFDF